jgi:hypothetical protein
MEASSREKLINRLDKYTRSFFLHHPLMKQGNTLPSEMNKIAKIKEQ